MASIKQIDVKTVHQIQSGQVIVDLCSVVKELIENSIDAGATNIDVRFRNQGLDLIEIQDNGSGISPDNYASVALKHHTSKLSSYSDIASLQTFGFRGEALASLCALSVLSVTTCQATEVPKGTKLTFEASGKLKSTSVIAAQKGSTVLVERLFYNLPVRRRELERNIKREWHKVIALLNQYACIQTDMKMSVSQQPTKGKRILLFSTKGNATTRDNIINIFGAKAMLSIVKLDLDLEMQRTSREPGWQRATSEDEASTRVRIVGHVSRPVHGEGRQTPDRQMFFVNGRPCGLPQFAKTFNEVYKSYNNHQSPFIFADIQLDTHLYDVNVSPDKRSILLHDQHQLLATLRSSLIELFDAQDYTVPTSRLPGLRQTSSADTASSRNSTPVSKQAAARNIDEKSGEQEGTLEEDTDADDDSVDDRLEGNKSESHQASKTRGTRIMPSRLLRTEGKDQSPISWYLKKHEARGDPDTGLQVQVHDTDPETEHQRLDETSTNAKDSLSSFAMDVDKDKPLPVRDFNRILAEHSPAAAPSLGVDVDIPKGQPEPDADDQDDDDDDDDDANEGEEPEENDLGQEEAETNELAIPASQPVRMARPHISLPQIQSPVRSRRSLREQPTVIIGGTPVTSSPEQSVSRSVREANHATSPSFGGRLASLFSARATPSELEDGMLPTPEEPDEKDEGDARSPTPFESEESGSEEGEDTVSPEASKSTEVPAVNEADMEDSGAMGSPGGARAELRAQSFINGGRRRDTLQLLQSIQVDENQIEAMFENWATQSLTSSGIDSEINAVEDLEDPDAESKLSLTINKDDFSRMRVAGQFNNGFIIATRPASTSSLSQSDELFIIDQHASDEKYNFERLQETTVFQPQRAVHPKRLGLTALEEEIALENIPIIESNGFKIEVDNTGDYAVGSRCLLTSLPQGRGIRFDDSDLIELIALLGDENHSGRVGGTALTNHFPRPSKARKMFASRACRSSIMIGTALNLVQMQGIVRHMGRLDKPWNCPHGRPTMRHLCRLDGWDDRGWRQDGMGDGKIWERYLG